jgi:Cdc6-like AAA superfamily ATPase
MIDTLVAALDGLRTAARQNSRKGAALADWIQSADPSAKGAASFVTERKQVYNRVGEQFDRAATDVIFLAYDTDIAAVLDREVRAKWYTALRTVAIFTYDGAYRLARLILRAGAPDAIAQFLSRQYGDTATVTVETDLGIAQASINAEEDELTRSPEPLQVAWQDAWENPPPPEELIGVESAYRQALTALRLNEATREKNVILLGPPGVGKSALAEYICRSLRVRHTQVTATAEWTTFETIGGYFPSGESRNLTFVAGLVTGSMLRNEWLIIDEINRADIDKCFGELFSVLSNQPVMLPYRHIVDGRSLRIVLGARRDPSHATELGIQPDNNWRIIGTMNTFDKASLFRMSAAFMRRFAFVEVGLPNATDYETLIRAQAESEFENQIERSQSVQTAIDHLVRTFAATQPPSLRDGGLEIGPAIIIDMIRYLSKSTDDLAAETIATILDAYRMFVLPQLEGRSEFYDPLAERLPLLLGVNSLPDRFLRDLADWLGHE